MSKRFFKNRLFPVLFMFIITLVFISVTTIIYTVTKDTIKFNESLRLRRAILFAAEVPVPEDQDEIEKIIAGRVKEIKDDRGNTRYYIVYKEDLTTVSSYVIIEKGAGLWGTITIAVGFDGEIKALRGVEVIDQNETPGLGGRISELWFKEQFRGKKSPFTKVAEGDPADENQFQAITGATYSSNAVMDILNTSSIEIKKIAGDSR